MGIPGQTFWTSSFKQCKRSLARGQGPRKKAKGVKYEDSHSPFKFNISKAEKAVKFGKGLFLFSTVTWMLRELELVNLDTGDLSLDHLAKKVTLHIKVSKADPTAKRRESGALCNVFV